MNSILNTIKGMLGIEESYTQFDSEITVNINSVFLALKQFGVGPKTFYITDMEQKWEEFVETLGLEAEDAKDAIEAVKMYIYLKVRLGFDPPTSAFVLTSIENQIKELEFRLLVECDNPPVIVEEVVE